MDITTGPGHIDLTFGSPDGPKTLRVRWVADLDAAMLRQDIADDITLTYAYGSAVDRAFLASAVERARRGDFGGAW